MQNDSMSSIDPPRQLLEDKGKRGLVIVSEVHRCSSYAHLVTSGGELKAAIGLTATAPVPGSHLSISNSSGCRP